MIVNLNRFITTALYVGLLQFLSISFKVKQSFKSCMQEEEKGKNQRYKKIKSTGRQKWWRERYSLFFTFKKCSMITENSWRWIPTHDTALRIKQFQNKTHLPPELRNGLSWEALGLTKGSTFPCCSQYCISSLTHIESLTLWTVSSRRSCSTKMRCVCKSLLLFPEGITADILLNSISL